MKTKIKMLLGALALFFIVNGRVSAQTCSYNVHNNLDCDVDVIVDYFDGAVVCNSVPANIQPNSSQNFNCGSCQQVTNVMVTLVAVGGVSMPPTMVVSSPFTPPGPSATAPTGCSASGNVSLSWATSDTAIIP